MDAPPALVFTDCPELCAPFFEQTLVWQKCASTELLAADRALCAGMIPETTAWVASAPAVHPFWSRLVIVENAPVSQFDVLQRLFRQKWQYPGGLACIALSGSKFHGHRGRPWAACRGNLHLTIGVAPGRSTKNFAHALVMVPAVATRETIFQVGRGALDPGIKWVNDILLQRQKVAGVLCAGQARGHTMENVVFGIGLNIEWAPDVEATPFVPEVGCLKQHLGDKCPELHALTWRLLDRFTDSYQMLLQKQGQAVFEAYRRHSLVIGQQVVVYQETAGEVSESMILARGRVEELTSELYLKLEGQQELVTRGRLVLADRPAVD